MKPNRHTKWTVLALALVNGFFANAQLNNVPGPADYARFSTLITERNIFDPGRYAHNSFAPRQRFTQRTRYAPAFTLVGTMSYEKGMFAFFDGNQPELRKVLYQPDTNGIAGFTVTEITPASVTLRTADKKQTVTMKIGEMMRQEGGNWQLAGPGESLAGTGAGESAAPAATDSSSPDTSSAPSPALGENDVLRKLMQQREQELK
jgi:hypothetical protein